MPRTRAERRETLAEERATQIVDAAARLFARQGYHHTTTKQIAAEAGIAEGTIYNYFASKQDLLLAMLNHLAEMDALVVTVGRSPAGSEHAFVIGLLRERLAVIDRNRHIFQAVMPQMLADAELREQVLNRFAGPALDALQRYVEAEIAAGRLRPVNPALHVRLIQALFMGIILLEIAGDTTLPEMHDQLPEAVADLILNGLLAEGAR